MGVKALCDGNVPILLLTFVTKPSAKLRQEKVSQNFQILIVAKFLLKCV